jgi:hypothetical protein
MSANVERPVDGNVEMKMRRARSLAFAALALITTIGVGYAFSDGPTCAWGFAGCGPETGMCKADCFTLMSCAPNGNPFDQCECAGSFCYTTFCEDVDT